jgi:hypothetical protein
MLHEKTFCKHLIGSVNVAMAYHDDVDKAKEKRKESVLTLDRHSNVGLEELSRKWNIGLETVKATLDVTMQHGELKGTWYLDTLIAKVKLLLGNKSAHVFTNGKYMKIMPMARWK